tara:strand:- start:135 stop:1115 length:981 start_codon:yes stop_codon:yes gene_type:complete
MKNYRYFINEALTSKYPLQILIKGKDLSGKTEDYTKSGMKEIYENYLLSVFTDEDGEYTKDIEEWQRNEIDFSLPILNFHNKGTNKILENKKANIYNKVEDFGISTDKVQFAKVFADMQNVAKTIYSLDDIEELKLPIIAKPTDGASAKGIEKFDTYEDARESKLEFDLWCECKDLDREFRAFIMNDEIILVTERVTNDSNDMSVGKKDANEKIDLIYIKQDMDKFPYMDDIGNIKKELDKKVNLDLYAIDLMLDKDGDLWIPEINGAPGLGPVEFIAIYRSWVELVYNTKVDKKNEDILNRIESEYIENHKKEYPKEYKSSLNPI